MISSEVLRFIRLEVARQANVILSGRTSKTTSQLEDIGDLFPGMPTITERPVMHPYGLVSRAPVGTISVVARQGDHIGNRLILGHRDKDRPEDVEEGEVWLYSQDGDLLQVKNGEIIAETGDFSVTADGDVVIEATGDTSLKSDGDVAVESTGDTSVEAANVTLTAEQEATITAGTNAIMDAVDILLKASGIKLGSSAAAEPFVLGSVLSTLVSGVLTAIASHTHISATPGNSTSPPANAAAFAAFQAQVDAGTLKSTKIFGEI